MKERTLRETKLFPPVRDWLASQGYTVFAECWGHDVVAYRGDWIVVVELKMSLTRRLYGQCVRATMFADAVYGATPCRPRALERFTETGLGVLRVTAAVETLSHPSNISRARNDSHHQRALERLRGWNPLANQVAGVPMLAGCGPRQDCVSRVRQYLAANPSAGWREIFRDVPNHYAHHRSMRGALQSIEFLRKEPTDAK